MRITHLFLATLAAICAFDFGSMAQTAPEGTASTGAELSMLRLRSGQILWGSIESHDPEGLSVRRLDQGGLARMSWSFLAPEEERQLRLQFGYVETKIEELMAKADRITLRDGTEVIGLVEKRDEQYLYLRVRGDLRPVNKGLIAGPSTLVEVPALEIFTRDELYQTKQFELSARMSAGGAMGAAAHLEMAKYCEALYDYERAVQHYEEAREADPSHEESVVVQGLRQARAKAAVQEQLDLLAEIDLWRARRRFDRALEGLATFEAQFPNTPVLEEFHKTKRRVEKYQERALREEVVRRWHYWTARIARKAATESETWEAVLAFLEDGMNVAVLENVTKDMQKLAPQIAPDQVRRLWQEREGGRVRQASYGHGTWLLGPDKARADVEQKATKEEPKDSAGAARQRIQDRIDRFRKNQKLAQKNRASEGSELEQPEDFWARWKSSNRTQWVLAYYVENSGEFRLEKARLSNCRECGGTGVRSVIFSGSAIAGSKAGERLVECPTCHQVGVVRRVRYR